MPKYWYHNAKTKEIDSYTDAEGITDFPRGVYLAYANYLTTGLKSKEEAEAWAAEWSACLNCEDSVRVRTGDPCSRCGNTTV